MYAPKRDDANARVLFYYEPASSGPGCYRTTTWQAWAPTPGGALPSEGTRARGKCGQSFRTSKYLPIVRCPMHTGDGSPRNVGKRSVVS